MPGDLALNFWRRNFACKDRCGFDIVHPALPPGLQMLRDNLCLMLGRDVPIYILSGCRCAIHNDNVGGSHTSEHLDGRAVDARAEGCHLTQFYEAALEIPVFKYGGIGLYPLERRLHLDCRGEADRPAARWIKIADQVIY